MRSSSIPHETHYADSHLFDSLEATITRPVGATIYWQLLEMHMADRDASFELLAARITVQRQQLTSTACPALRPRLDALWKVKSSLPTRDVIVLHPVIRHFVVDLPSGRIDASLYEDDHPLVRWGQTTFDALIRCSMKP